MSQEQESKQALWKTYGILMGLMLGGSVIVLAGQAIWNGIQEANARQAMAEKEAKDKKELSERESHFKYTSLLGQIASRYDIKAVESDLKKDMDAASQYCGNVSAGKSDPQSDIGTLAKKTDGEIDLQHKHAVVISQIQIYCPQNSNKLPKEVQNILSSLNTMTKKQAVAVLNRWQQAKSSIFASPFDRDLAAKLTTGEVLDDIIKRDGSIDWLQNNNAYYSYGAYSVEPTQKFEAGNDWAELEVIVKQELTLYSRGKADIKQDTSRYSYRLVKENGDWKISTRKEIK